MLHFDGSEACSSYLLFAAFSESPANASDYKML
jgi:hypothetical protein